jgi:hypothetical protein
MKRLLDDSIRPELAELLRSADLDAPAEPKDRQDRIVAAIVAAPAAATTIGLAGSGGRVALVTRVAKWCAPVLGVVVAAAVAISSRSAETPDSTAVSTGAAPRSAETPAPTLPPPTGSDHGSAEPTPLGASPAAPSSAAPSPAAPSVRVEDLPTAAGSSQPLPRPRSENAPRPNAVATAPAAEPTIDAEIVAIDAARGALTSGHASEALARVQQYRSGFAAPHFADEADALEVQALAALGRGEEARHKAKRFLEEHAQSPYAQRVRSAVGLK